MFLAPKHLPSPADMLADLPHGPSAVARYLKVSERTLWRWIATDKMPHAARLAMFWETRWGRDINTTTAQNGAMYHRAHIASLEAEIRRLQAQIERITPLADTANSPVFRRS